MLHGWEMVLVVAMVLFATRSDSSFWRGLMRRLRALRDALDREHFDAGQSVAGIHGNRAAEALTPDNQVAELYHPAAFEKEHRPVNFLQRLSDKIVSPLRRALSRIFIRLMRHPCR